MILKAKAWDGEQMLYPEYISVKDVPTKLFDKDGKEIPYTELLFSVQHKDSMGIEIFDGDILQVGFSELPHVVFNTEGCWMYKPVDNSSMSRILCYKGVLNMVTVIGNKFEDPYYLNPSPTQEEKDAFAVKCKQGARELKSMQSGYSGRKLKSRRSWD